MSRQFWIWLIIILVAIGFIIGVSIKKSNSDEQETGNVIPTSIQAGGQQNADSDSTLTGNDIYAENSVGEEEDSILFSDSALIEAPISA